MLTDQQFENLLEKISINQQDRERLIRIETIVQMTLENEQRCKADIICQVASVKTSSIKAHERLDAEVKARERQAGAVAAICVGCTVIAIILKLTGHL